MLTHSFIVNSHLSTQKKEVLHSNDRFIDWPKF